MRLSDSDSESEQWAPTIKLFSASTLRMIYLVHTNVGDHKMPRRSDNLLSILTEMGK
jgi:hypothetical protein